MALPDTNPPPSNSTGRDDLRHGAWLMLALMVVATVLRLPLLDRSVWFDEACMSHQRIGTTAQLLATLYTDIHPPLFVAFMHLWNSWFGDSEISMRIPAMISGLLCLPLTYWVGDRLIGRGPAMLAATLLALSPVHVWYCTEARLYAPMILTSLFLVGSVERLTDERLGSQRWLLLAHLGNVAVMLSLHYYLAIFVVALAVLAPVLMRGLKPRARSLLLWHGVGTLLLGAFVLLKMQLGEFETSQDYLRAIDGPALFQFLFSWCFTGNTLQAADASLLRGLGSGFVWFGVLLAALGVIQILRHIRLAPRALLIPLGVILLPCFLFACVLLGYGNTYLERSLIPSLPFLFLLAAAGVQLLPGKLRVPTSVALIAISAIALITLYGSFDSKWTVYKPHPDWRSAAKYLGHEIDSGNAGALVFTSMPNPRSLSYYDSRIQDAKNLEVELTPAQLSSKVTKRLGETVGKWAEASFTAFASYNQELLAEAKLVVHRCQPTPQQLHLPESRQREICYLVRNRWHPHASVDGSVEALLAHPQTKVLHTERCQGVTVYKVRFEP